MTPYLAGYHFKGQTGTSIQCCWCWFSKWTEIVSIRKATTETLRKPARERIIATYGVPKMVITDNEVELMSRAFKRYLEELGVRHQRYYRARVRSRLDIAVKGRPIWGRRVRTTSQLTRDPRVITTSQRKRTVSE